MIQRPRQEAEVVLPGGITNAGRVTRMGTTVRRPGRVTAAATEALLEHLERAGFDGAPRHLGRDEHGREVLTYVDGEVPIEPTPAWALTDEALVSVAELLRRFHDAAASFDPSRHAWPAVVPARFGGRLMCHNDPNLDNVVFRDGRAAALIDFDLAAPGSAVWDVACAVRLWAPLRAEEDVPEAVRGRSLARARLFAEAYGLGAEDRARLPAAARAAHEWGYDVVRRAADDGHAGFARLWEEGARARAERSARWLAEHEPALRHGLLTRAG
jgi:Ser/Thr protein kinase RdoA (MazF antagonist)